MPKHQAFEAEVQAHEEIMTSVAKVTARPSAHTLPQSEDTRMAKGKGLRQGKPPSPHQALVSSSL